MRVTATKREESLQEIPVAVTAITRMRLDELNATRFQDYFRDVPGLMMDVDAQGHFDFNLRGTTSSIAGIPSTTATVAQYIDEIPVTTTQAQIDMRLMDVERFEVLRGPQGTLYGQDALGGVIRIITRQPDLHRFFASAEGQLGKVEQGGTGDQEGAAVNIPLMPGKVALRAHYFKALDAGYVDLVETLSAGDPRILRIIRKNANTNAAEGSRITAMLAPNESWRMVFAMIRLDHHADMMDAYQPDMGDLYAPVSCGTEGPHRSPAASTQPRDKERIYII